MFRLVYMIVCTCPNAFPRPRFAAFLLPYKCFMATSTWTSQQITSVAYAAYAAAVVATFIAVNVVVPEPYMVSRVG